uniref:GDSL esterase/lipase At1g29670 n=1 Tax=Anthurium amnicola TaxID=1678845 RepID=A0A1D1YCZ3_9ARAE
MVPPKASSRFIILLSFIMLGSLTNPCKGEHGGGRGEAGDAGRGVFVFGSSLVDNGNNNFLPEPGVRADYAPYGLDFPAGPSGRFSNGKNPVDALAELLKLPGRVPPFLDPTTTGDRILHGVNYASGGSGILDETRPTRGTVISLNQQISNFERVTLPQLTTQLGRHGGRHSAELHKYLFVVGTGGNDYLLNYYLGGVANTVSLQDFTALLTSTFVSQLKKLHGLGARKFVLLSVQPIGCVPVVKALLHAANGSCVEAINEAALLFNRNLSSLVDNMGQQMPGSHLVYVNSYTIITDIIQNPTQRGFTETSLGCCETSPTNGNGVLCKKEGRVCEDRHAYVFFDGLHPTEAVNLRIAEKAYGSPRKDEAYPINVKQLLRRGL